MARAQRMVKAPVERVWVLLADAYTYDQWVVGAKGIRRVEGRWPEAGSRFHHTVGVGPLTLHDNTESCVSEEPCRLVIEARARPLGRAEVEFTLTESATGTVVSMEEHAVSPALIRWLNPLLDPLVRARNVETLRRLDSLARRDTPT